MNTRDDKLDRLEQGLIRAHGSAPTPDPGPVFTDGVMTRIMKQSGSAQHTFDTASSETDTMWDRVLLPFACSCAGAALVLAVVGYSAFQGLDMDMLGAAYADTSSLLDVWTGTF